jgi:hypothetical protein
MTSVADPKTLDLILWAREVLDANAVPAPDMYFDRRTGEWFKREGDKWVLIPAIDDDLLPAGPA